MNSEPDEAILRRKATNTISRRLLVGALSILAAVSQGYQAKAAGQHASYPPFVSQVFVIQRGAERLTVEVQSPPADRIAPHPLLLLNFAADRKSALCEGAYGGPARLFLQHGQRVASFDLPAHGDRVDRHGSGIEGMCALFVDGKDPFKLFVADGQALIDECLRRSIVEKGRIVVCGVSRAGYCALRLAAADSRVSAVAGLAPVTDWRDLREFTRVKDRPDVAALSLDNYADQLAGHRIYIAIGNSDRRVGTQACVRFAQLLFTQESRVGIQRSHVRFLVVDDTIGHGLADRWRVEGAQFLLDGGNLTPAGIEKMP